MQAGHGSIHCHVSNLSRLDKQGGVHHAVLKAAYNAGQAIWCEREERMASFTYRRDVIFTEIITPVEAPEWAKDRTSLWNKVDTTAKRKDSRLAKNIHCAITYGIPQAQWAEMAREYAAPYVAAGHIVDIAIHEDGTGQNPHVHFMLTVNTLKPNGFGLKLKNIEHKSFVITARRGWEAVTNKYLKVNGLSLRVDARSFKARGIAQTPSRHRGANKHERALKRQYTRGHQNTVHPTQEATMSNDKQNPYRKIPTNHEYLAYQEEIPLEQPTHDLTPEDEAQIKYMEDERNYPDTPYPELTSKQWSELTEARDVALHEPVTQQEKALRSSVSDAPVPIKQEIDNQILHQKTQRVLAKEEQARLQYLQDNLTAEQLQKLEQFWNDEQKHQPDLLRPEPGPHYDLYSRGELEVARQRQQEEHEREDRDR